MPPSTSSACILFRGKESLSVKHALNLIASLLNSCPHNLDKKALLICTRPSLYEALDSLDERFTSSFCYDCFPASQDSTAAAIDSEAFLNNILYRSFGSATRETLNTSLAKTIKSEPVTNDYCSVSSGSQSTKSQSTVKSEDKVKAELKPDPLGFGIGSSQDTPHFLKRLLVRFIDEPPRTRLMDGEVVDCTQEAQDNAFWNYVRAAHEFSAHGEAVDYVVVCGLSEIILSCSSHVTPNSSESDRQHAFTGIAATDRSRNFMQMGLSMYALSVAVSINEMKARKKEEDITECPGRCIPRFYLLDSIPSHDEDASKFTRFMTQRFDFAFSVH